MDIFLVRHGEAAASWGQCSDPGLSELGAEQAEQTAKVLLGQVCANTLLLSSPLARAREPAAPLAQDLDRPVQIDDVFCEIPAPVALAQRQAWLRQFMQQHWRQQPAGLLEWRAAALQRLVALRQPAVVFTHFLVINAIVGQVQDRSETLCFRPGNGSITRLRHTGTSLELLALGEEMETVVH
jgi:probable phosphoglycerate mutase